MDEKTREITQDNMTPEEQHAEMRRIVKNMRGILARDAEPDGRAYSVREADIGDVTAPPRHLEGVRAARRAVALEKRIEEDS